MKLKTAIFLFLFCVSGAFAGTPEEHGAIVGEVNESQQAANVLAFQAALDDQGEVVLQSNAIYKLSNSIRMKSHTWLHGGAKTRIIWTHNGAGIDTYAYDQSGHIYKAKVENWKISNVSLEGANNGYNGQVTGNSAIVIGQNTSLENAQSWGGESIEDVVIYNWGDAGVKIAGAAYSVNINRNRIMQVYDGVTIGTAVTATTGIGITNNVFEAVGNDVLRATGDNGTHFTGNRTNGDIKRFYTYLIDSSEPYVAGNRMEGTESNDFGHKWHNVLNGYFRGGVKENIFLSGASKYNDINYSHWQNGWSSPQIGVYEDNANGAGFNRIHIFDYTTTPWIYAYSPSAATPLTSEVVVSGNNTGSFIGTNILTTSTAITQGGTYLCDCSDSEIQITLPYTWSNPFATFHIEKIAGNNHCVISSAGAYDGSFSVTLYAIGEYIELRAKPYFAVFGTHPYAHYLGRYWQTIGKGRS